MSDKPLPSGHARLCLHNSASGHLHPLRSISSHEPLLISFDKFALLNYKFRRSLKIIDLDAHLKKARFMAVLRILRKTKMASWEYRRSHGAPFLCFNTWPSIAWMMLRIHLRPCSLSMIDFVAKGNHI